MPRFFVKKEQVKETTIEILGEDIKHIKNVLRKQIGENIEICDKDTKKSYICEIEKIEEKSILTKIIEELQSNDNKIEVDIYQGLPKADKMEFNNTKISRIRSKRNYSSRNEEMCSKNSN